MIAADLFRGCVPPGGGPAVTFAIHLTGPRIEDAACAGKHRLFDAVDPESHAEAAALCRRCPALAACDALLGEVMAKSPDHRQAGTIAGRLITKKGRLL